MSYPSSEELRQNLWEVYVFSVVEKKPATSDERQQAAIRALHIERERFDKARAINDVVELSDSLSRAKLIWQLLGQEIGSDLLTTSAFDAIVKVPFEKTSRHQLLLYLAVQEDLGPPTHRRSLDPVSVLLPRALMVELRQALEALEQGETLPLLEPVPTDGRGKAWSSDEMQARALEHVEFLVGQGIQKQIAQANVSRALSVSPQTLRKWKVDATCLEAARRAGALNSRLRNDPDFGSRPGETIESADLHLNEALSIGEGLNAFGARYKSAFGTRHWSSSSND